MRLRTRLPTVFLLFSGLAAAAIAACAGDDDAPVDGAALATSEAEIVAVDLECRGPATVFKTSTPDGGAGVVGTLTEWMDKTAFDCTTPEGGAVYLACTEQPQSVHEGTYEIEVVRADGGGFAATLRKDEGVEVPLRCIVPQKLEDDPDAATVPTYDEVAPIIASACNRCHQGVFSTLERVRAKKEVMYTRISSGLMPRGNPNFRFTDDGKKLLDFLRNSPELSSAWSSAPDASSSADASDD